MHFLSDNGRDRRRNFQIKKKVVLSPGKDEKGDYIETERGDKDESRRLKECSLRHILVTLKITSSQIAWLLLKLFHPQSLIVTTLLLSILKREDASCLLELVMMASMLSEAYLVLSMNLLRPPNRGKISMLQLPPPKRPGDLIEGVGI